MSAFENMTKNKSPRISVIVPVYKVEKYLHECVDSILAQTYTDFELILVDDGSPDNCGKICDEYAAKDSRVQVIHQENRGVSAARNAALDVAKGEFIAFIDSDDVVNVYYLEVLLSGMDEDTDIVACKYQSFQDGEETNAYDRQMSVIYQEMDPVTLVVALHNGASGISVGIWQKLYRTDIVRDHRFPVGKTHEDQFFTPIVCYKARKAAVCNLPLYYYRVRTDSITHRSFDVKRYDDILGFDYCIQYFRERHEEAIVQAIENMRSYRIATYSVYAHRDKVTVPAEYRISLPKALWRLRKMTDDNYFQYYLAQIHPKLPVLHSYWVKIKRILRITK